MNGMIPSAANTLQCIVYGEENPQNCAFPLKFHHPARGGPSHGHMQHAEKKIVKMPCVGSSGDMLMDRQTHSPHYLTTAPVSEVIILPTLYKYNNDVLHMI